MKKSVSIYFSLYILVIALSGFKQSVNELGQLQGSVNINSIQGNRRFAWFADNYTAYQTNPSAIEQLAKLSPQLSFIIFTASWDEKSQQVLAQFYKCIDEAKINRTRTVAYFLDRDLKSPQGLEQQFRINQLPTVILMKGNYELARISDISSSSIEAGLADIINN